jgi:hypothetical protein
MGWANRSKSCHVMQDLSRNTDYVYVVPTGDITGVNNLTNDYYESTIYHTTNAVFVKKVVRFSKRIPPRFLATSDAPAAGLATPL